MNDPIKIVNPEIAIASFVSNLKKYINIGIVIPPPPNPDILDNDKNIIKIIIPIISIN